MKTPLQRLRELTARLRRYSKRKGLQFILSLYFSLAATIGMLLLALFITMRSDVTTQNIMREESERLVSQINVNLDSALRDIMRISDSVYYRVLKKSDLGSPKMLNDFSLLYESNTAALASIAVFSDRGELLMAHPDQKMKKNARVNAQSWFIDAMTTIENVHFSNPHVQRLFVEPSSEYHWVITLSRSVQLTKDGAVSQGVLAVDMNYSLIEQILKNVNMRGRGYLYLTHHDGSIIYHPRQQLLFSGTIEENNLLNAGYEEGVSRESYQGQERMITVKTVGYTGWKIIAVNPLNTLEDSGKELRTFSFFFVVTAIFLIILTNFILSSHIAKPIKDMESQVLALEAGQTASFRSDPAASPEIQHLGSAIEALLRQQEVLRADILQEQESKRRSELEALQAQIHPHFLYNTLDSIIWMIENERYPGAVEMVSALARFFRLSLARGQHIITIEKELEQVENYLAIQKVRYRNQFSYRISAEEAILNCLTIKLIVQPLVENAINHGMAAQDDEGEIEVRAYSRDDELYIDVSDNGLGMTEEQQQALLNGGLSELGKNSAKGSGIGVANVQERIQLYFGRDYGLSIISAPDEGTVVRIHLPLSYNEPREQAGRLPNEEAERAEGGPGQ